MMHLAPRRLVVQLVSVALITLGFAPASHAGIVGTSDLIDAETRLQGLNNIDLLLERQDVRDQLQRLGVSPEAVTARVQNLTPAEIRTLNENLDELVAGGDALGLIGAVFLVLLILELLGVTNVFSAI